MTRVIANKQYTRQRTAPWSEYSTYDRSCESLASVSPSGQLYAVNASTLAEGKHFKLINSSPPNYPKLPLRFSRAYERLNPARDPLEDRRESVEQSTSAASRPRDPENGFCDRMGNDECSPSPLSPFTPTPFSFLLFSPVDHGA